MLSIAQRLLKLRQDQRGTSLLELAIAAPVFAILLVGVADLGRGFSERYSLQQAVNRTIEMAHLGSTQPNYNFLIAEAATAANVPQANVTLAQWLECNGTRKTFGETCADGQQIARHITLTEQSTFTPSFGAAGYPGATNGVVPISASASLRVQ